MQTYTAIYYVLADILMLGLYFYYKAKNKFSTSECLCQCLSLLVDGLQYKPTLVSMQILKCGEDGSITPKLSTLLLPHVAAYTSSLIIPIAYVWKVQYGVGALTSHYVFWIHR